MPSPHCSEQRDARFQELDRLIALGYGDVDGWQRPHIRPRRLYALRRKAHPRTMRHRPEYEPPEVRRRIYLEETGRLAALVAERNAAYRDVSQRLKTPAPEAGQIRKVATA